MEFNNKSNLLTSRSEQHPYCEWRIRLICERKETFKILLLAASVLNAVVFIISIATLFWKSCYRSSCSPSNNNNNNNNNTSKNKIIMKICEWSSIDLILLWIIIHCLCRGLCCVITALDLFSNNMVLRMSIFNISFIPLYFFILIYLANIFRLIPKLTFDQTSNSSSNITTIWIPKDKQVTIIFWFSSIFILLSISSLALIRGYFASNLEKNFSRTFSLCLETILILIQTSIGICLIYYGKILVDLTKQSMVLAGVEDDVKNDSLLSKALIRKMRIFNITCGFLFLGGTLTVIPYLIHYKSLRRIFILDISIFAAVVLVLPLIILILVISILLPEFRNKHTPFNLPENLFPTQKHSILNQDV